MSTEVTEDYESRCARDQLVIRRVISGAANKLLDQWRDLPAERRGELHDALTFVLADAAAAGVCIIGTAASSKERFLDIMGATYDRAVVLKHAMDTGAFV